MLRDYVGLQEHAIVSGWPEASCDVTLGMPADLRRTEFLDPGKNNLLYCLDDARVAGLDFGVTEGDLRGCAEQLHEDFLEPRRVDRAHLSTSSGINSSRARAICPVWLKDANRSMGMSSPSSAYSRIRSATASGVP